MTSLPPGTPVVAYLRDSGGDAQELSLAQQEDEIRRYCQQHGLVLTRIFKDEARPGSSAVGREAFQDMVHHFRTRRGPEKALIIWKYSRFARSIDDAQYYRADLRRRGIHIISLHDNIPDGPAGRFFEAALDWMNEQFLHDLSTDVKRGLRHIVLQHGCVPGRPPFGFKREPVHIGQRRDGTPHICHRWVPDPDKAPLVRQAFDMRAAGIPISQIHAQLHIFRSRNSYTAFFRNKLYIGILEYGGHTIQDYCPPIVPLETFRRVQALMDDAAQRFGRHHPRRANSPFLLSGLAHCALCGAPLYGHVTTRPDPRKGRDEAYRCTRAKRGAGCNAPRIPRLAFEAAVLDALFNDILTPDHLAALYRDLLDHLRHTTEQGQHLTTHLQETLRILNRQISNLTRAIAQRGPSPALLDRLQALETERAEIQAQLTQLQRPLTDQTPPPDLDPRDLAIALSTILRNGDTATRRTLLKLFIQRIEVVREGKTLRGVIYYHFPLLNTNQAPDKAPGLPMYPCPHGDAVYRHPFSAIVRRYRTSSLRI